jgi:acetylglutamate kinase
MICDPADPELGFVGEPAEVDPAVLLNLFEDDMIPVVAPLGAGRAGETYNINGDTAAGAIAAALKADRLLLLTDVAGVKNAAGEVLTQLSATEVEQMTANGVIAGGMIPKTETAVNAVRNGVRACTIVDGRVNNAVLLELFTAHGAGSMIRA